MQAPGVPVHFDMVWAVTDEWAVHAARLVVDEGLDYRSAKRKAARALHLERSRQAPSHEQIEDEVREHLAIFCADTQPRELLVLRLIAARWMQRLALLNPHLSRAVWRGTATKHSRVCIELYADDPKLAEIHLLNQGIRSQHCTPGVDDVVFTHDAFDADLAAPMGIDFVVHDADDLRGALKPDSRGRTWRGDLGALQRLLASSDGGASR